MISKCCLLQNMMNEPAIHIIIHKLKIVTQEASQLPTPWGSGVGASNGAPW